LYQISERRELDRLYGQRAAAGLTLAFSPNGGILAAAPRPIHRGPFTARLYLWTTSDRQALATLTVKDGAFEPIAFSVAGVVLAALNAPGRLRLWKIELPGKKARP